MPGALPASNDMRAAPHEADAPDDATPNSRNIDGAQGNVTVESNPTPAANALGASTLHGANGDIDEIVANAARAYSADPGQQFAQQANWDRSLQSGLREQALIGGLQNQFGRMANDSIAESRAQDVALKQALGPEFAASANGALAQQRAQHAAKAAAAARLDAARNAAGLDFGRGANDWSDDAAPIDFGNRSASWSDGDASPSMLDRAKSVAKWADQPIGWLDDVRKTAQRGNEQIGDALNALGLHGLADAHGAWGDLTGSSMPTRPWELALSAAPYAGKAGPLLREGATAFGPQIERMFERAVPSLRVNMVPDGPSFGPASPEGSSPKSASPEGSSSTPAYPDGLAYRTDLARHLIGPDGFKQSGALHGTHNLENAKAALDRKNATYNLNPTGTNGISELGYQYTKPNGSVVKESKTVYDPSVFSDQAMLDLSQRVGQRAYEAYLKDPSKTRADLSEGGMNLRAYINIDRKTGLPYVGNVHPLGD
ncbi:hypothetical protein AWB76_07849 [Caballeronia temeraria]|uniref:Bacterial EndoU nuclease domain-containing protein n=2 Tax=Caballeronia temeraria TaxID=1777137 RepID=A0A158E128_9BURK|nr:hypothetical protein AWB76_07849 [Caballeronia temeraria]